MNDISTTDLQAVYFPHTVTLATTRDGLFIASCSHCAAISPPVALISQAVDSLVMQNRQAA